jgi:hypothetical protein
MGGGAPVNRVDSYAVRTGHRVDLVLSDPESSWDAEVVVVLRRGERRLRSAASLVDDIDGRRLVASFPADALADGQYRAVVRVAGAPVRTGARLVVDGDLPVVLRWGTD